MSQIFNSIHKRTCIELQLFTVSIEIEFYNSLDDFTEKVLYQTNDFGIHDDCMENGWKSNEWNIKLMNLFTMFRSKIVSLIYGSQNTNPIEYIELDVMGHSAYIIIYDNDERNKKSIFHLKIEPNWW